MTVRNLRVLGVDKDENLLVVNGAVPGPNGGYVVITKAKKPPRERRGFGGATTVNPLKASKRAAMQEEVVQWPVVSGRSRSDGRLIESDNELKIKNMATIDVLDLSGKKVGTLDLADEVFGAVNEDLLWEAVKHYRAGGAPEPTPPRTRSWCQRRGQEAVEAEGNRPRSRGLDPVATVASRRHGSRTSAPLLRVRVSQEEAAGRVALGTGGEVGRWQADWWWRASSSTNQDEGVP